MILLFTFSVWVNANPLDDLMLKNCGLHSAAQACSQRLTEIRQGLAKDKIQAPPLKIDSQINTVIVREPKQMVSYFCLARFYKIIPDEDFDEDLFAYAVKGFAFGDSATAAKACKTERPKHPYTIVLNPVAFFESGADTDFFDAAAVTFNHERLHAIFAHEKARAKVLKFGRKLSQGQRQQFKREHPSYNFKDEDVLARDFFSYTFERDPAKAYDFLAQDWSPARLKELCRFCVADTFDAKSLSQLAPADLLKFIEKEAKVLILSTGRKDPSPLFSWGKLRTDEGQLNQITKLEGAMGKTLCKGEKPEAKDGITIVLAADSPYSTLVHEYLHLRQIKKDGAWCPISKALWTRAPLAHEERMVRDREWDVRQVLWTLRDGPHMTVEDRLIIADGLMNEAKMRALYDPAAADFIAKNNIAKGRDKAVREYTELLKTPK